MHKKRYLQKYCRRVDARFDTSNYDLERQLSKAKNKNVIGSMKDQLGGQLMNGFVRLRAKTYSYLKDNNDEEKKKKAQKTVSQKENLNLKFKFYILNFKF